MNISTYAPALVLLYVFAFLWILMGVDLRSFSRRDRWMILLVTLLLCFCNDLLRKLIGPVAYGKLLFFSMHLPTFFVFLRLAKRGIIKTAFMILTALIFTTPTVIIGNVVRRVLFVDSSLALLITNLISYIVMLLFAGLVFRNIFNYLLIHGDSRIFLLFSVLPIVFYIYMLAAVNLDFSALSSFGGYVVRLIPTVEAFCFYFLLPYIYKALREKMLMQSAQDALQLKLASSENQLNILSEANMRTAVYRHDMRHQLVLLDGLLSGGKTEQAQEFVKAAVADLDTIVPKQFCKNGTVNLLCSSYNSKAQQLGVQLKITACLPNTLPLSDVELCSVVSNGLENALLAASQPELFDKWVEFYCEAKQNNLLIQIRNPYYGQVTMRDGLPVSDREGHGYGCLSIQTIVQRNGGLCSFSAENCLFTLRVILPLAD